MLTRAALLSVSLLLALASATNAATTYKVPFTVVPGSVTFTPTGNVGGTTPIATAFPVSQQVVADTTSSGCTVGLVTVEAALVDGALELGIDGYVVGSGCTLGGRVEFDLELEVPEFGGTTTVARLVPSLTGSNFVDFEQLRTRYTIGIYGMTTSSIPDYPVAVVAQDHSLEASWGPGSPPISFGSSIPIQPMLWVPGDTLRFRPSVDINILGTSRHDAQGSGTIRWEYRVAVPEPSAALTLPVGAMSVALMAAWRPVELRGDLTD